MGIIFLLISGKIGIVLCSKIEKTHCHFFEQLIIFLQTHSMIKYRHNPIKISIVHILFNEKSATALNNDYTINNSCIIDWNIDMMKEKDL